MRSLKSLAGLALIGHSAALEHREIIHRARSQASYIHSRDVSRDTSTSEPCSLLSEVFESAVSNNADTDQGLIVDVPPSVGIACLKSVPVSKQRDLALIEHLRPYISFQSTIETLADPPEEYLLHGVDIWGGLEEIEQKLQDDEYASQYEVMTDLRSIFAAANDNHFDYPPALLNTFLYVRRNLDFISLSSNGISLPQIYHAADVHRGNHHELDYHPSHVTDIDGIPIVEWLEQDAARNTLNYQDPDAQYNNLFSSVPGQAAGKAGVTLISQFEVPDNYTVNFWNGSSLVVKNEILFPAGVDFSGIHDGEKFQEAFEIVPDDVEDDDDDDSRTPDIGRASSSDDGGDDPPVRVQGYPSPVVKHSYNSIAGYFLNDEEHQDVAVLSILSFLPIGLQLSQLTTFNITEYVLEARDVIVEFIHAAQEDGRDKLVLDLSANGGGSILFAQEVYRLLFPDGDFTSYDRYRLNEALEASAAADYEQFLSMFVSTTYPIDVDGEKMKDGDDFIGPFTAGGQNVTAPFQLDLSTPWAVDTWINGFEPVRQLTAIPTAPFEPENIIIVTDGTCASACGILTGLLTRNHGIRTLALGGRPNHLPMQSMGGVRGTLVSLSSDILTAFKQFTRAVSTSSTSRSILEDITDSIPSFSLPPLKPLIRGDAGGRVNSRNGYSTDDIDGLPLHFKYEAANGRLFYTQLMSADVRETWRRAAGVAWRGEKCVRGSTVNDDHTMGDETVAFTTAVRTEVQPLEGPGALPVRW